MSIEDITFVVHMVFILFVPPLDFVLLNRSLVYIHFVASLFASVSSSAIVNVLSKFFNYKYTPGFSTRFGASIFPSRVHFLLHTIILSLPT